jgi:hypothetical protein
MKLLIAKVKEEALRRIQELEARVGGSTGV